MPIWMLTYTPKKQGKKKKVFTYAMNGYTGKIYGQLPISGWKVAALCGAIFAAIVPIVTLIGGMIL